MPNAAQLTLFIAAVSGSVLRVGADKMTPMWYTFTTAVFITSAGYFLYDCFKAARP